MINSIQQFQENGIGKIEKVTSKFILQEEKSLKKEAEYLYIDADENHVPLQFEETKGLIKI